MRPILRPITSSKNGVGVFFAKQKLTLTPFLLAFDYHAVTFARFFGIGNTPLFICSFIDDRIIYITGRLASCLARSFWVVLEEVQLRDAIIDR